MPAPAYSTSLTEFDVNLLVAEVPAAIAFAKTVLEIETVHADPDLAVLRGGSDEWILHADHTYEYHPIPGFVSGTEGAGAGVELRMPGIDKDAAETRAHEARYTVWAGALDKPHVL